MSPTLSSPGATDLVADLLAQRFAALHGRAPDGMYAAPGRVNLIGEHTDYNHGPCLPIALPHVTLVAAARRADDRLTVISLQQDEPFSARLDEIGPGQVTGWASYPAGVVWAARRAGIAVPGLDLLVHGTVPLGAGLSSSAALSCAVGLAVCGMAGVALDDTVRHRLVELCGAAEREVAGAPTGGMDQTVSLFARADHALLIDFRDSTLRQVPWRPSDAGASLLVIDTRASHSLADGGYAARRAECRRAAEALGVATLREAFDRKLVADAIVDPLLRRRARHVLSEMGRVARVVEALGDNDLRLVGSVLTQSHRSLADDFEVSCDELDVTCEAALDAGALGARMTGGGFGGSVIALVPEGKVPAIRSAVAAAFAERSWVAPAFHAAVASQSGRGLAFGESGAR